MTSLTLSPNFFLNVHQKILKKELVVYFGFLGDETLHLRNLILTTFEEMDHQELFTSP